MLFIYIERTCGVFTSQREQRVAVEDLRSLIETGR